MLCKLLFFSLAAIGLVAGRPTTTDREQQLQELLLKECKRYGAEDKVPELIEVTHKFRDCILENINEQDFAALQRTTTEDAPEPFIGFVLQLCKKKSELEVCLFTALDAVMPCMDPATQAGLDDHKHALQDLGNYTCKNNAQIIKDLFEDGALLCVHSKQFDLDACFMTMDKVDADSLSTAAACRKVTQLRDCLVSTFHRCPKPTLADFVQKNIDTLLKGTRCDNENNIITERSEDEFSRHQSYYPKRRREQNYVKLQ